MHKDKAASLMSDALAERSVLEDEMASLHERIARNGRKLEVSARLLGAARDVDPVLALQLLTRNPEAFVALQPGRIGFNWRLDAGIFLERGAYMTIRQACRGQITTVQASAILDRLDTISEFEGGELTGAVVPYIGGTYRTGLIGYMLLRPWEIANDIAMGNRQPVLDKIWREAQGEGDCRRLLNHIAQTTKAPDLWLAPLASRLMRRVPDANLQSRDGITLVAMATRNDWDVSVIRVLLEEGANPFLKDMEDDDAVHHAHDAGRHEVVEEMLQAGEGLDPVAAQEWREKLMEADGPRL